MSFPGIKKKYIKKNFWLKKIAKSENICILFIKIQKHANILVKIGVGNIEFTNLIGSNKKIIVNVYLFLFQLKTSFNFH